jgi:peptide/nickel transport system permease protein
VVELPAPSRTLDAPAGEKPRGRLASAVARLGDSRTAVVGGALVLLWVAVAALAPWVAPYDPSAPDALALADPRPGAAHWLGVDQLGRDLLSRILWGARTVLAVAPLAVLSAYLVGTALGLVAGYYGGWVDMVISRFSDVVLSFPVLILYVILITSFGPSPLNIVVAVTVASSPGIGRIVRSLALELRGSEYVAAAELRGESPLYIMVVEMLPNARGPMIVDACLRLGYVTIAIGVLGFLGLGLRPPTPDWGGMVRDATSLITVWPHMAIFPCLAITSLVIGFNLLADGLREIGLRE